MENKFKSGHNWIGKPNPYPYKEEDLLAQKIFGCEFFNWLSFWEQFHIVQKYNFNDSIITK
jgi:hypothetical protein